MIGRIHERIWHLRHRRQKNRRNKPMLPYAPVKGSLKSVIVVKPENGVFSEAVFILSDEYLRSQRDLTQELLSQAGEAAAEYMHSVYLPRKRRRGAALWMAAASALVLAALFLWIKIF